MSPHTEQSAIDLESLQDAILQSLGERIVPENFANWFHEFRLVGCEGSVFEFRVPSGFLRDWILKNYLGDISHSVRAVTGLQQVTIKVMAAAGLRRPTATPEQPAAQSAGELSPSNATNGQDPANGRNPANGRDLDGSGAGPAAGLGPASAAGPQRAGDVLRETLGDADARSGGAPGAGSNGHRSDGRGSDGAEVAAELRQAELESGRRDVDAGGSWTAGRVNFASSAALNRNYTFETFVVGPCNRLSHAAALAVGDNPGRAYNPLFVHGNVGLGKTHLLQAICHAVERRREIRRVLYMSCEDFTNRFIHSIQSGRLDEFREFHRSVDVLVIDDVQFLANKEKTQEEFFHTFNALYNTNRQIIISSDRSPTEIPTVEERLVSRFKWGLVAEMEVPCFETRVAIIKRKSRLRQVEMPDDVAFFIAERIDTNIRELEGAVIKVLGVASITSRDLSVELTEEALKGVVVSRSRKLTMSDIMGLVTAHFSVSARELTGKGRTQAISLPRQICMYLCRQHTDQSLEEIGRFFGNRDHTTVIYALQRIKKRLKEDRVFNELVTTLGNRLHN